jgi:hypothetical protein
MVQAHPEWDHKDFQIPRADQTQEVPAIVGGVMVNPIERIFPAMPVFTTFWNARRCRLRAKGDDSVVAPTRQSTADNRQ